MIPFSYLLALSSRAAPSAQDYVVPVRAVPLVGAAGAVPDAFVEVSVSLNHTLEPNAWMPYRQILQERPSAFRMPEVMHNAFLRWVARFRPDGRDVDTWEFPYGAFPLDELEHWSYANIRTDPNGAASSDWVRYRVGWDDWQAVRPGADVPVLADGVVVAIFKDVIGWSIVVAHDLVQDGWRFHSIYCHTLPKVRVGDRVVESQGITTVAESHTPAPTHLDFSTAWIHEGFVPNGWPTLFFPAVAFVDHFDGIPISEVVRDGTRFVHVAEIDVRNLHLPTPNPSSAEFEQAGMEEMTEAHWRQLEEGRSGRGLVVVAAPLLQDEQGPVATGLRTMSNAFAQDIIVWGDDLLPLIHLNAQRRQLALAPISGHQVYEPFIHDLERRLRDREATVLALADDRNTLPPSLNSLRVDSAITVRSVTPESLSQWLQALGVPESVLKQMGLEERIGERYVGSGT